MSLSGTGAEPNQDLKDGGPRGDHVPFRADSNHSSSRESGGSVSEEYEDPQYESVVLEKANGANLSRAVSKQSTNSTGSKIVVLFAPNDPDNPYNWTKTKKVSIVLLSIILVFNSTIGSSFPSAEEEPLFRKFGVSGSGNGALPISLYLIGYTLGPLLFAPLSERYGRQIILAGTFLGYTIFTLASVWSPNWAAFNIFRLFLGTFACTPISVVGGLYADMYNTPKARGRAMAMFMTTTMWGPCAGPVVGGFLGDISWRWPLVFMIAFAGLTWVPLVFLPETFGPTILQRRAKKMRKEDPGCNVYAPIELESKSFRAEMKVTLSRPFMMLFKEPLVFLSCLYCALIYAIFYLFLQAFPLIFPPIYGFNLGETGLAFLSLGVGSLTACVIYLAWESFLDRARAQGKSWAQSEEYRRLPLACMGGPLFAISCFWIGWTAKESIPWIVPVLGGIPFGAGYLLLFNALLNYLVDAYEIYGASALAASTTTRSLCGAALPFATSKMYHTLGINWACSLIGFICIAMCVIPFAFLKYGDKIRARSKFCQQLLEEKRIRAEKEEKRRARNERHAAQKRSAADASSPINEKAADYV